MKIIILLLAFVHWTPWISFTRTNGDVYVLNADSPHTNWLVSSIVAGGRFNNGTNSWNGESYSIDWMNDRLIRNGSTVVGYLYWYGSNVWNTQRHHGFTVTPDGTAYLLTADDDDGNVDFILWIDLASGAVTNYTYIADGITSRINSAHWGVYISEGLRE